VRLHNVSSSAVNLHLCKHSACVSTGFLFCLFFYLFLLWSHVSVRMLHYIHCRRRVLHAITAVRILTLSASTLLKILWTWLTI